jgi:hypothetical protein
MRRLSIRAGSLALLAVVAGGCSDAGPSALNQLSFNLATRPAPAAAGGASYGIIGTPETFSDGTNSLVINKVELVLREIELHRAGAAWNEPLNMLTAPVMRSEGRKYIGSNR